MKDHYILAIDQGTTSSCTIIFDRQGQPVSIARKEFKQHYSGPGWIEHDPTDISSSQSSVTAEAVERSKARVSEEGS